VTAAEEFYDGIAEVYDTLYVDEDARREDELLRRLVQDVAADYPFVRVLDVGCGTGWALDHVVSVAGYVGFDVSATMLDRLRAKHAGATVAHWDMTREWPVRAESFDLVLCLFSSPNYADPAHVAAQGARALVSDGRLVTVAHSPAVEASRVAGDVYGPAMMYSPEIGWRPWDPDDVKRHFTDCGLDVEVNTDFCADGLDVPDSPFLYTVARKD
jgi:SAM-dependent methyltransferase